MRVQPNRATPAGARARRESVKDGLSWRMRQRTALGERLSALFGAPDGDSEYGQ